MKKRVSLVLALFVIAACSKEPTPPPLPPKLTVNGTVEPQMPDGHPSLPSLSISSRGPRRLSVDQLQRTLDNLGELPPGSVVLPPDLAVTLGKSDYKRVTEEQLEPTPLFMKFMLDFGAIYCGDLAMAEATRTDAKIFTRFSTVDENLRFLLLRFTGIEGSDADPYVTRLQAVYQAGSQSSAPLSGYQAVCVSLFTSPEFLLY
jgi:hypothetical protein